MILLINPAPSPKSPWGLSKMLPPLGLAYIAAALENAGFQVKIFDNYLHKKPLNHVKLLLEKLSPEIVGISCNSINYRQCIEMAKVVKEAVPSCYVIVGGPHPTYMPESMLQHSEIDYVVMGEGERVIVELATCIKRGADIKEISKIPGVAYRYEEKVWKNPMAFIEDLDTIPYPARHLLSMNLYDRTNEFLDVKPVDVMNVIRGCPYDCKFCETVKLWGHRCRAFSPTRVVQEVEHLLDNYGSKGIYFMGDNFTIYRDKTMKICELLKEHKIDIEWACDTRVDLISRELLEKMYAVGCRTIWFGVESGSPRILKHINRGITLEQALHAFKLCKEIGIHTACSFMLGIPGETIEDMKASLEFAKKLDPDWCQFNIYIAYPCSALYDEIIQKGLYSRIEDFVVYVKTDEFDYELMLKIQKLFIKKFESSPIRTFRRMKRRLLKILNIEKVRI
ncbi:MAG: radical SAM protein [Candidatus Bathyarchaeia archaeon]